MQWIAALAALVQIFAWSSPAMAQQVIGQRTVSTTSWVEEWDPANHRWVRVGDSAEQVRARVEAAPSEYPRVTEYTMAGRVDRFAKRSPRAPLERALAQYGPFLVVDNQRAAMVGSTDTASPSHFDAMLRDYPGLMTLELIEAPGTSNDIANMAVGRRIRAHGLATHVPNNGSVRSGAVELFLAGVDRTMEVGAQFAVHSWLDNYGREPDDFAPDAPANRLYLDYYMEMGMSEARARAFYAMTNSVPHHSAKWLRAYEMERWIRPEALEVAKTGPIASVAPPVLARGFGPIQRAPKITYSDMSVVTLSLSRVTLAQAFLDS